ncbi:D-alanine--D-alanine ligase [Patescibacteria group bacterium]|nr:D-alanine--D-alanine ligase [Patescibacteria group bacterium]
MKVIILTGGISNEREVSLTSAKNVEKALTKLGYEVELFDINEGLENLQIDRDDIVFPVIHGKEGEGGDLQEVLEKRNIKFVGSGSKALKKGWEKIPFKKFCDQEGIVTPKWQIIKNQNEISIPMPIVIKPSDSGSSIDVFFAHSKSDLDEIPFKELFGRYRELIVEEFIQGIEVTCGVLGNIALPVLEIVPPEGGSFDYENKYNGKTQEIPFAPSLSKETQEEIQKIALKIHQKLGCKDISRSDFLVKDGVIYALEINTIPGLTSESLFPKEAKAIGISFDDLMDRLVRMQN